jgi:desulfoferrodoxin-like iron-binding protein
MAVEKIGENYECAICGNEVRVTQVGGGTLFCCGQEMELIKSPENLPPTVSLPDSGG